LDKSVFKDILNTDEVEGIMLFSLDGKLLFKEILTPVAVEGFEKGDWWRLLFEAMKDVAEADLVFEKCRIYMRKTVVGFLIVLMGIFAPVAMVRLNCDILTPSLKKASSSKLGSFFKKRE
jgi:hypothetical protein